MNSSLDKPVRINTPVPANVQDLQYSNAEGYSGNGLSGAGGNCVFINFPANTYPSVEQPELPQQRMTKRPWHYSLISCTSDCNTLCESCCCTACQISRQCNMIWHNTPEIHCLYCLMMSTGYCTFMNLFTCIGAMQVRTALRHRYGLSGSDCGDVCAACFCQCCVVQQVLREMISMNEFPGATCFQYVTPRLIPVMN